MTFSHSTGHRARRPVFAVPSLLLASLLWLGFGRGGKHAVATTAATVLKPMTVSAKALVSPAVEAALTEDDGGDRLAADPRILAQQVAYNRGSSYKGPRERIIRVGLSTGGGNIALWSHSAMLVSDAGQLGRRLTVPPETAVVLSMGPVQQLVAHGQKFVGPITIQLPSGSYGAWRTPNLWVAGGPTHVSSNGEAPRYARAYHGSFEISPQTYTFDASTHRSALRVVNLISLEDYLRGVVPWEMDADAPIEALKAQAICARSESMAKILAGRHSLDGYDICDYDHCQGYSGTENETAASDRAVRETAGLVMFTGSHIADAVYGTNSGGITSDKNDVWRGGPEPYLRSVRDFSPARDAATARVVKSRMTEADWAVYCSTNLPSYAQPSRAMIADLARRRRRSARTAGLFQEGDLPEFYRWTRVVSATDLGAAMARKAAPGASPMTIATEVRVLERAPSGHIKRLGITGRAANGSLVTVVLVKDGEVRSMLSGHLGSDNALPSSTFVALPRRDAKGVVSAWIFKGAGWGHGAGMCQRGAQNHALEGWSARQIIAYYYHGLQLRKIQ